MSNRSPALAAFLSLLFPGLGQVYAGQTRRGALWAIPMVFVIVLALVLVIGGSRSLSALLTANAALALVLFDVAFLIYHVAAMVDAYRVAQRNGPAATTGPGRRSASIALAALVLLAIVVH